MRETLSFPAVPTDSIESLEPPAARLERRLLILAGLFIAVNLLALSILRPDSVSTNGLALLAWIACAGVGHVVLNWLLPHRDGLLFALVMFLSGWGLVLIDRLAPRFADRQTLWLVISTAALLLVVALPRILDWLRQYRYLLLTGGLLLLGSTILLGSNPSGQAGAPQFWLGFAGIYFQPSEPLKIILVVFLASYLAEQYPSLRAEGLVTGNRLLALSPRVFGPILLMWGLSVVVLVWQRDLGTAVLFFAVFLLLIYVASGTTLILFSGAGLIVLAGLAAYSLFDVVQLRVDIWLNPWPEADGRAYQIVQSLQAIASGGVFGQGIGQGYPMYIPVVHSDFIFAAMAEEFGLIGVITTIAVFIVIVVRGLNIAALHQGQPFRALLAIGLSAVIGVQSLMIMGGVVRLLPLTGVTLPFVSYGGSSLLTSFVLIGLLLRLSERDKAQFTT
ncbi:MAG: FtsW/RodA/SpoVE family cell cycle protein [Phototrophicaceae bacterium]